MLYILKVCRRKFRSHTDLVNSCHPARRGPDLIWFDFLHYDQNIEKHIIYIYTFIIRKFTYNSGKMHIYFYPNNVRMQLNNSALDQMMEPLW